MNRQLLIFGIAFLTLIFLGAVFTNSSKKLEKSEELKQTIFDYGYSCGMENVKSILVYGRTDYKFSDSIYTRDSLILNKILRK